jgi:hypothetical protein
MPSLWFVVPVHGREALARICLRQLWRTCHDLTENGVEAYAVVVGEGALIDYARDELGFGWVKRDNQYTSLKFNDGILLACTKGNADYVVPCGSDDWVDYRLFLDLPDSRTMVGFQRMAFVREDGRELTVREINSYGGCGIRIWPRKLLATRGYWPAAPNRRRGCDTSMLNNVRETCPDIRVEHRDLDPLQIVDWKSPGQNLNPYAALERRKIEYRGDPFTVLADRYPFEAVEEMQAHYGLVPA